MDPAPAQPPPHRPRYVVYDEILGRLMRSTSSPELNSNKVLGHLYGSNLILARLALFTDHVRMAYSDVNERILQEDYRKIQPDLSQYCKYIIYNSVLVTTC